MSEWSLVDTFYLGDYNQQLEIHADEYGQFMFNLPDLGVEMEVSATELWSIAKRIVKFAERDQE